MTTLVAAASAHAQSATKSELMGSLVVEDYKLEEDKPVGVYGQPEWVISGGIFKTLVDNLLSAGIEGKWTKPDEEA